MSEEKCIFKTSHPYFKKGAESCRVHARPCDDIAFMCNENCTFYKMAQDNKRLREALESIATCNYSDKKATNLEWCKVTAKQALGA